MVMPEFPCEVRQTQISRAPTQFFASNFYIEDDWNPSYLFGATKNANARHNKFRKNSRVSPENEPYHNAHLF